MTTSVTIERQIHFRKKHRGHKSVSIGVAKKMPDMPTGRVPWVSRLMALAIKFDQYIKDSVVKDYAELARLGQVSRSRVSQIMDLLLLAPDIQEEILFLPRTERGRDAVGEREVRRILKENDWQWQRELWRKRFCIDPGSQ